MTSPKKKPKIKAEKRKVLGRKVKKLRQEGVLPANLYGKKVKSQALQLDLNTFLPVYKKAGETGVVELTMKGESKARPVLIHNVQLDPVSDLPLHADFYQVSLKEKVTTEIPVEIVGESPAVKEKQGVLIQPLSTVEVEALPTQLPDKFEVDITGLKKIDDFFPVGDLKAPEGVQILTGAKQILAKIEPPTQEEAPSAEPTAEAEKEEGAEEGEGVPAKEGAKEGEAKETKTEAEKEPSSTPPAKEKEAGSDKEKSPKKS